MAQRLTIRSVAKACRDAYEAGKLGFQRDKKRSGCRYLYQDGHVCAIGAALTPETLKEIRRQRKMTASLWGIYDSDIVKVAEGHFFSLRNLQRLHDAACNSPSKKNVTAFLDHLDSLLVETKQRKVRRAA